MAGALQLIARPLSATAFAPFGDVIEAGSSDATLINSGTSARYSDLACLEAGVGGRLIVSIYRAQARCFPLQISMLECHPKSSQAFMPLSRQPFIVVVAPCASHPSLEDICVFYANAGQGINFAPGVWHHPLLAVEPGEFLVIERNHDGDNCDEALLECPFWIGDVGVVAC